MGAGILKRKNIKFGVNPRGKRGSYLDVIYIMIFLFAFAIMTLIAFYIHGQIKPEFLNNAEMPNMNNTASRAGFEKSETTIKGFDYLFIFIMIGLLISTVILAFMIPSHPALFFISL